MYLLDANAFIEANRLYYAFDIAPGSGPESQSHEAATDPNRGTAMGDRRGRPNRRHS